MHLRLRRTFIEVAGPEDHDDPLLAAGRAASSGRRATSEPRRANAADVADELQQRYIEQLEGSWVPSSSSRQQADETCPVAVSLTDAADASLRTFVCERGADESLSTEADIAPCRLSDILTGRGRGQAGSPCGSLCVTLGSGSDWAEVDSGDFRLDDCDARCDAESGSAMEERPRSACQEVELVKAERYTASEILPTQGRHDVPEFPKHHPYCATNYQREQLFADGSASTHWHEADTRWNTGRPARDLFHGRRADVACSEPGGYGRHRFDGDRYQDQVIRRPQGTPRAPVGRCGDLNEREAEADREEFPRSSLDQSAVGNNNDATILSALVGQWRLEVAQQDGSFSEWSHGVWTIEEDGRALFNGKHFGDSYDIRVKDDSIIQTEGGWTASFSEGAQGCPQEGACQRLVWSKEGETEQFAWTRKATRPSGAPRARESQSELRSKMKASADKMMNDWGSAGSGDRLSSAMAVIEEIPGRISEGMQRATSYVVDNMQSEVAIMSKQIRSDAETRAQATQKDPRECKATETVVKNLEVIPTMVLNLLEARVEKARAKVRTRVSGMIENLSCIQEKNWEDHELLVSQMRMISEEVEQIAGDAVKAAAQECHTHASRQLDYALGVLRENRGEDEEGAEWRTGEGDQQPGSSGPPGRFGEVTHDPELWQKTVTFDPGFWENKMEQAVAVVQDKHYKPQDLTNQVVADQLLRARIRSGGGSTGSRGVQSAQISQQGREARNPGSRGHPDLCMRPCLYFGQGHCKNGQECRFCHFPHPKRPVRFDKQHRETLRKLPFERLACYMLPILRQKAAELELSAEVQGLLDILFGSLQKRIDEDANGRGPHALSPTGPPAASVPPAADGECWPIQLEAPGGAPEQEASPRQGSTKRLSIDKSSCASMHSLRSAVSSAGSATGSEGTFDTRRRANFEGVLRAMGFRSLLSMLASKAPTDGHQEWDIVDSVFRNVHAGTAISESDKVEGPHADTAPSTSSRAASPRGPPSSGLGRRLGKPAGRSSPGPGGTEIQTPPERLLKPRDVDPRHRADFGDGGPGRGRGRPRPRAAPAAAPARARPG